MNRQRNPYSKILIVAFFILFGCVSTQQNEGNSETSEKETISNDAQARTDDDDKPAEGILNEPVPTVSGPKRTVAVGKFDAIGSFREKYGDWDVGGGLSAMLVTALIESDRFLVMERANIGQILSEQELKGQKLVTPGSGPEMGKLIGVQLLIYGSVTEFDESEKGGGFSLGASTGSIGNMFSGAISPQFAKGKVAMDVRVVDTTTGEILETHRVEEEVSSKAVDFSISHKDISLGTNAFFKTPLGKAARQAINRSVQLVALDAQKKAWTGQIVDVDEQNVYINAGAHSGLKAGDQFVVERIVKKFTDPQTGKVLGTRKKELGILKLSTVEEKMAYGAFQPLDVDAPQRGDLVVTKEVMAVK